MVNMDAFDSRQQGDASTGVLASRAWGGEAGSIRKAVQQKSEAVRGCARRVRTRPAWRFVVCLWTGMCRRLEARPHGDSRLSNQAKVIATVRPVSDRSTLPIRARQRATGLRHSSVSPRIIG